MLETRVRFLFLTLATISFVSFYPYSPVMACDCAITGECRGSTSN
ncbi:hypothetical protein [Cytobacillus massiliigabonensis]|nr:hypothetical protein [Cytobacillus massiliigabonensis]